jgi:hypothetical protein
VPDEKDSDLGLFTNWLPWLSDGWKGVTFGVGIGWPAGLSKTNVIYGGVSKFTPVSLEMLGPMAENNAGRQVIGSSGDSRSFQIESEGKE